VSCPAVSLNKGDDVAEHGNRRHGYQAAPKNAAPPWPPGRGVGCIALCRHRIHKAYIIATAMVLTRFPQGL
jgi:hypothetical protein